MNSLTPFSFESVTCRLCGARGRWRQVTRLLLGTWWEQHPPCLTAVAGRLRAGGRKGYCVWDAGTQWTLWGQTADGARACEVESPGKIITGN